MIGTDQSQLKTFVNNPKPTRNILLPGDPFPFHSDHTKLTRAAQVNVRQNILAPTMSVSVS